MSVEELKQEINTLKGKVATLEKQKSDAVKARDNEIAKIVVERRREIEKTFDEIILEVEKRWQATKSDKENEKKKNLNNLIEKNTREVREKNVYLNNQIKSVLTTNKLPGFVNSNFYFAVWSPHNIGQFLLGFIVFLAVLAVPTVVCFVTHKEQISKIASNDIFKIIIIGLVYVAVIFIFGLIWLLIEKLTKKNKEALKEIIELRKNIQSNNKKISNISKKTSKEISDDDYDYTKLDREIESLKIELETRKNERKTALDKFANETEEDIKNKISREAAKAIDAFEEEIENTKKELQAKQKEHDDQKIAELN